MLELKNITVHYDKVEAIKNISIHAEPGAIVSLIGSNGAGKSTCLRAISGLVPLTSGEIWFADKKINGMKPENIARLGIAHIPEGKRLFYRLTVYKNLMSGAFIRRDRDGIIKSLNETYEYFPVLKRKYRELAKSLSGGEQQMLVFGRAFLSKPKLFLLDEPSIGLAPIIVGHLANIIKQIANEGAAVVLVEQNAALALKISRYAYVLENGRIALEGDANELKNNKEVRKAYLGL